jgi:hypothetical protein
VLRNTNELKRDLKFRPSGSFGGECLSVYYPRLIRDGWQYLGRKEIAAWQSRDIFEKPLTNNWVLRKIAHSEIHAGPGKGCYWDEHELLHSESGECLSWPGWEWADFDGKRLLWAEGGKLLAGRLKSKGIYAERELFDFNEMAFERITAPY